MIVSAVISRPVQVSVLSNTYAVNMAALKAIDISGMAGNTQISVAGYYTPGDGGGGTFYYDSGSSSTDDGGTIIAPDAGGGRWKRIFSGIVNVKHFGAKGDGSTNDNDAFRMASALVSSYGGGTLVIPPGTYVIGKQDFAGASGQGYAYRAHDVVYITGCTRPVRIDAAGAKLVVAAGLKYGAFDPTTGNSYNGGSTFTNSDYRADCPRVIRIQDNTGGVSIVGPIEIDGNSANLVAGGSFGDTGYQVYGYGIYIHSACRNTVCYDVYTHDNVVDGVLFQSDVTSFSDPPDDSALYNIVSENNGRQGISITAANGLSLYNCRFSKSGRGAVASAPMSGCDIEPASVGICRNIQFYSCEFSDNKSNGLVSGSGNIGLTREIGFTNCLFWSSDGATAWVQSDGFTFNRCRFFGGEVSYTYEAGPSDEGATRFLNCEFSDLPYPGRTVDTNRVTKPVNNLRGGLFDNCIFHNRYYSQSGRRYVLFSTNNLPHTYRNCRFINYSNSESSGTYLGLVRGATFEGDCIATSYHTGGNTYYISASDNIGNYYKGSLVVSGMRWGPSYATGFDGDVAQYYSTTASKFLQAGTATNGTFARMSSATTTPTTGQWYRGDIILNTSVAAAGQTSYWQCITSGWLATAWAPNTVYAAGTVKKNGSDFYTCTTNGTSASSGGPTGTGTGITDGTTVWDWLSSTTAVLQAKTL